MSTLTRTTSLAVLTGLCACGYMILPPVGRRRRRRRQNRHRALQKTFIRRCVTWLSTDVHSQSSQSNRIGGNSYSSRVESTEESLFKHPPTWLYTPDANGSDMIAAHKLRSQYSQRRLRKDSLDQYKDIYGAGDYGNSPDASEDEDAHNPHNYTTDLFSSLQTDPHDDFFYARMVTGQPHTPGTSMVHLADTDNTSEVNSTPAARVYADTNVNVGVGGEDSSFGDSVGSKGGVDTEADIDSVMLHLQSLVQAMEMKPKDNSLTFDAPETSLHFQTVGSDESTDSQAKAAEELAAMMSRLTA